MSDDYFKDEKPSVFKSILGLASFSTTLPIKVYTSIEYMTRMTWFWPFIHLVIGVLAFIVAYVCLNFLHFSNLFTAILVFTFILLITGFNHIDGVMDMADGLMVHGTAEKKISVMKDSMVGAGGVSAAVLLCLITVGALDNLLTYNCLFGIIIVEMLSKTSLLTTALVSKPLNQGIGKYFIEAVGYKKYILSIIIAAIISYLLCGFAGIFALIGAVFAGGLVAHIAKHSFRVANGDVLGASNEIGRVMALIFMLIALFYLM